MSFEPCFRVRNVASALDHYRRLGFSTSTHDATYAFAHLDGLTIHLMQLDGDEFATSTLYLHVPDADAVAVEWESVGATVSGPVDTDYGLREGAHTDLDGNLIRFGSPLRASLAGEAIE